MPGGINFPDQNQLYHEDGTPLSRTEQNDFVGGAFRDLGIYASILAVTGIVSAVGGSAVPFFVGVGLGAIWLLFLSPTSRKGKGKEHVTSCTHKTRNRGMWWTPANLEPLGDDLAASRKHQEED